MKFCPFIGVACKNEDCELYIKSDSACCLTLMAREIRRARDAVSSSGKDEERSLLQEISNALKPLVMISKSSEELTKSTDETVKSIYTTVQETESGLARLQSETVEKFFSVLSTVLEKVDESFKQVGKNYKETNRFLSELRTRTEEELTRRKLDEALQHNDRGVALFYSGNREAARIEFERGIELHPEFPEAYNNLALTLTELHLNDEAIENFEKAYALKPDLFVAYSNLALIHFKRGDMEEAIKLLRKATKKPHSNSIAHLNLGNALLKSGKYEEALHAWERALEIDPSNANAEEKIVLYREGKLSGHNRQD